MHPQAHDLDWVGVELLHHAAHALHHIGQFAEVELVMELHGTGQEVVHDQAVKLHRRLRDLGRIFGRFKFEVAHVTLDEGGVD